MHLSRWQSVCLGLSPLWSMQSLFTLSLDRLHKTGPKQQTGDNRGDGGSPPPLSAPPSLYGTSNTHILLLLPKLTTYHGFFLSSLDLPFCWISVCKSKPVPGTASHPIHKSPSCSPLVKWIIIVSVHHTFTRSLMFWCLRLPNIMEIYGNVSKWTAYIVRHVLQY